MEPEVGVDDLPVVPGLGMSLSCRDGRSEGNQPVRARIAETVALQQSPHAIEVGDLVWCERSDNDASVHLMGRESIPLQQAKGLTHGVAGDVEALRERG